MSEKQGKQPLIRFIFLYVAFLLPSTVNGDRKPNDERLAMIEVTPRQDTELAPPGESLGHKTEESPESDKSLHGVYTKAGSVQNAVGALINYPSCEKDDEEFLKRKTEEDWIALMEYPSSEQSNETAECLFVMDRVKKAMLFGASAIIILTMNPNILQELDVVLLLKKPVVVMDDLGNITTILRALKRVVKLKVKVTHGPPLFDTQANSSLFWAYVFSALAVIVLLLLITRNGLLFQRDDNWDNKSVGVSTWQRLSCLKIKRYRKAATECEDSEPDICAICMEIFYQRQKVRVLPCVHQFHTKCIDPWLVRRPFCPLCKTNVLETSRFGNIFQNVAW